MKTAVKEELIDSNPAEGADRPRIPKRNWRILKPEEIRRVSKAFTDDQARGVFLTLVLTGLRASELRRLRWRDVSLSEKVLRVVDSKSESGIRSIAIPSSLAEELNGHYQRTAFKGDGELVFCHPKLGTSYSKDLWTPLLHRGVESRRHHGPRAAVPRSSTHSDHARRRVGSERACDHDQGRPFVVRDDADLSASGRHGVPRGGRADGAYGARRIFYGTFYRPERTTGHRARRGWLDSTRLASPSPHPATLHFPG
jgi:integrase